MNLPLMCKEARRGKKRPAMGERRVHMGSVLVGYYILFRVAIVATSPLKFHSHSPESPDPALASGR